MSDNIENKNPMLSIIVPVYNVENYIEKCVQSLIEQTLKDTEIIIVNDGTKDKSIDIVRKFNDKRIKIINKRNGGLSSARNVGIKVANGKYITFVDSDDFIELDSAYEEMIGIANKYNADIVVGNASYYYNDGKKVSMNVEMSFENRIISNEQYIIKCVDTKRIFVPVWLNIYKKDLIINNNLYFEEGILHEDELFSTQIFIKAKKIALYKKKFYDYRQRQGSIMYSESNMGKRLTDIFSICLKLTELVDALPDGKFKSALLNYTVYIALGNISYKHRIKLSKSIKKMLIHNSSERKLKLKAFLLNFNEPIYYFVQFIVSKIRRLYRSLHILIL